jgi:hypothetical protein
LIMSTPLSGWLDIMLYKLKVKLDNEYK